MGASKKQTTSDGTLRGPQTGDWELLRSESWLGRVEIEESLVWQIKKMSESAACSHSNREIAHQTAIYRCSVNVFLILMILDHRTPDAPCLVFESHNPNWHSRFPIFDVGSGID